MTILPSHARARYGWWHPHGWPERLKIFGLLAIAFAVWGWFDVRLRGTVDPNNQGIHKTDFTVYTEAGAAFFDGRAPYEVTNPRGWGYLYPPPFAMLVAPLDALDTRTQVLIWFAVSVAMLYGCYAESVRIARILAPARQQNVVFGPVPLAVGWASVVAAALPALNCLQRGQVGVAKLYLLLLGFRLCVGSRSWLQSCLAGAVLALPIVLKVTPLVPVGMLVAASLIAAWRSAERRAAFGRANALAGGVLCGLVLWLVLLPAAFVGWSTNLNHLSTWWHSVAINVEHSSSDEFAGDSASPRNQSLSNAVERFGNWAHHVFAGGANDFDPRAERMQGHTFVMDAPSVAVAIALARILAAGLLVWATCRVAWNRDWMGMAAAVGLACVATLILSPISRGHYYVLLAPAVMYSGAWLAERARPRWTLAAVAIPAALSVAHYLAVDVIGRVGLLGLGISLWYAVMCSTLALSRRREQAAREMLVAGVQDFRRLPARPVGRGLLDQPADQAAALTDRAPSYRDDLYARADDGSR
ncbi:MAG: glycosyltransferase family 87 protein [Pirellulales bacterium]